MRHAERGAARRRAAASRSSTAQTGAARRRRPRELAGAVATLVADPARRDALGEAARARARGFTWDAHGGGQPRGARRRRRGPSAPGCATRCARSETGKAGRAGRRDAGSTTRSSSSSRSSSRACSAPTATARWPRSSPAFLILLGRRAVDPGRRRARGGARPPRRPTGACAPRCSAWTRAARSSRSWSLTAPRRRPARAAGRPASGSPDVPWAAAGLPATGVAVAAAVAAARGAAGAAAYRPVGVSIIGEAGARLVCALVLWGVGLGVTGAYSARRSPSCSWRCGSGACWRRRRRARRPRPRRRRRGATLRSAGRRRLGPDRRPAAARGAAERRRDRRPAPVRRRRCRLLRGGGGRGQVGGLGRDRRRAAPAARGDAARRGRPRPAPGAAARARRSSPRSRRRRC